MTGQHFVDRKPAARLCARCNRLELFGIDEGIAIRVDPMPLTVAAEIQAIQAGLRTYAIIGDFITYRDSFRMRGDARGRPAVLATHQCRRLLGDAERDPRIVAEVKRILRNASRDRENHADIPEREMDALFAVSEGLSGLIIKTNAL